MIFNGYLNMNFEGMGAKKHDPKLFSCDRELRQ
jgi:hypothetical protein